jgi:hypothetical protein
LLLATPPVLATALKPVAGTKKALTRAQKLTKALKARKNIRATRSGQAARRKHLKVRSAEEEKK